jgi:peroxiredoxin
VDASDRSGVAASGPARLEKGQRFPELTAAAASGEEMTLPGALDGAWALVVFYRGHW